MSPLLSIVIPTKNRQKYAFSTIKNILSFTHKSFELIVYDNSDSNILEKKLLESINDSRLSYYYNNLALSIVDNFNYSMKHVNGKYVCYIGDDDGINPNIMKVVEWANKNDFDAIIPSNPVTYSWPDFKNSGELVIYPFTGNHNKIDVKKNLQKFLKNGAVYYLNYGLPKVYHGILKKECFDRVYDKLGYYFGGLSPDIFASVAVSSFYPKNVVTIDYPITVSGTSYESDKTHETKEAKNTELSSAPHFNNRGSYEWSNHVPSVYSVSSIWAESGIHALEDLKRSDLINKINKYKMASEIALDSPQNEKLIIDTFLNPNNHWNIYLIYYLLKNSVRFSKSLKRISNRLFKILLGKKSIKMKNLNSIEVAMIKMTKHIDKNDVKIDEVLKK